MDEKQWRCSRTTCAGPSHGPRRLGPTLPRTIRARTLLEAMAWTIEALSARPAAPTPTAADSPRRIATGAGMLADASERLRARLAARRLLPRPAARCRRPECRAAIRSPALEPDEPGAARCRRGAGPRRLDRDRRRRQPRRDRARTRVRSGRQRDRRVRIDGARPAAGRRRAVRAAALRRAPVSTGTGLREEHRPMPSRRRFRPGSSRPSRASSPARAASDAVAVGRVRRARPLARRCVARGAPRARRLSGRSAVGSAGPEKPAPSGRRCRRSHRQTAGAQFLTSIEPPMRRHRSRPVR